MDLFIVALIALPIIGIKVSKAGFGDNYLSLQQTNQLKGFFALVVILHHLAQRTKGGVLFPFFNHVGYLAVSIFLFISGYGLMLQYMKRKEEYIKHFLSRRLLKVVMPYLIAIVIYYVSYLIIGLEMSITIALKTFLTGYPIVAHSWYVLAIIFFYLVFYLSARLFKNHYNYMIIAVLAGSVLYCIICNKMGFGTWWYNTCICFLLGMIWAIYEKQISAWLDKRWLISFLISLGGAVLFYQLARKYSHIGLQYHLTTHYLSSIFFCFTVIIAGKKLQFENKLLKYLGDISYETYLLHGLVLIFQRNDIWSFGSDLQYTAITLIASPLAAIAFYKLNELIFKPAKIRKQAVEL